MVVLSALVVVVSVVAVVIALQFIFANYEDEEEFIEDVEKGTKGPEDIGRRQSGGTGTSKLEWE